MAELTPESTSLLWSTLPSYSDVASPLLESACEAITDTATSIQNEIVGQASEAANSVYESTEAVYESTEAVAESASILYDSISTKGVVPTLWSYTPEFVKSTAYELSSDWIGERQVDTLIRSAEAFWNAESGQGFDAVTQLVQQEYAKELDEAKATIRKYYESAEKRVNGFFYPEERSAQTVAVEAKASPINVSTPTTAAKPVAVKTVVAKSNLQSQPVYLIQQPFVRDDRAFYPVLHTEETTPTVSLAASDNAKETFSRDEDSLSSIESRKSRILPDVCLESDKTDFAMVSEMADNSGQTVTEIGSQVAANLHSFPISNLVSDHSDEPQNVKTSSDTLAIKNSIEDQDLLLNQNFQAVADGSSLVDTELTTTSIHTPQIDGSANPSTAHQNQIKFQAEPQSQNIATVFQSKKETASAAEKNAPTPRSESESDLAAASSLFITGFVASDFSYATDVGGHALKLSEAQYAQVSTPQLFKAMLVSFSGFAGRILHKPESVMDTAVQEGLWANDIDRAYHVVTRNEMDSDSHPESEQQTTVFLDDEEDHVSEEGDRIHSNRPRDVSISYV